MNRSNLANRTLFILCGGDSTRMQQDKATLNLGSSTFLEVLIERASSYFSDIRLLSGGRNYEQQSLPVYKDEISHAGPLSALLTGCRVSNDKEFAIHTVDAPLISERILDLMANFQLPPDNDAALFKDEKHLHPLSGIYHPRITPDLGQQLEREEFAVMRFISSLNVHVFSCREDELINVNRPGDYDRLKKIYQSRNSKFDSRM